MIGGIGADIIKIERIEKALHRSDTFAKRVFTEEELKYILRSGKINAASAAANFAAKEAVSKALGTGLRGFSFTDIEIYHDGLGAPHVVLMNEALNKARGGKIHLSLSHERDYAVAYAVWEIQEEKP